MPDQDALLGKASGGKADSPVAHTFSDLVGVV